MNYVSSITSTLDLLDAYHDDKEFDKMIARNKFLGECKAKGFERMKRLGLISNATRRPRLYFTDEQKKEFASKAYELRKKGLTYDSIRAELGGIAEKSIREWMRKYDILTSE